MRQMAESAKVGETVYVDGFLKRCDDGDVLIDPAVLRDPTAPFTPQHQDTEQNVDGNPH